jgi:hypothetical protein
LVDPLSASVKQFDPRRHNLLRANEASQKIGIGSIAGCYRFETVDGPGLQVVGAATALSKARICASAAIALRAPTSDASAMEIAGDPARERRLDGRT